MWCIFVRFSLPLCDLMWHLFCSKTQISRPLWFCFSSLGRPLYVTLYCGLLCEMAWRHNSIKQTCSIHSKNKDENLHFFMKEWWCFTFQGWVGKKLAYLNSWDQICKYLLNGIRRQTTPISNHVSKADMLAAQVTMFRHCLHFTLQGVLLSHTVYKCDFQLILRLSVHFATFDFQL